MKSWNDGCGSFIIFNNGFRNMKYLVEEQWVSTIPKPTPEDKQNYGLGEINEAKSTMKRQYSQERMKGKEGFNVLANTKKLELTAIISAQEENIKGISCINHQVEPAEGGGQ